MARYLDADSLLEQISKKKCEVGKIRYLDGFNDGLMRVRSMISTAPNADVVPKSEVENYKQIAETQQKLSMDRYFEIKELKEDIERLKDDNKYLQDKVFKVQLEVARDIFEEIESKKTFLKDCVGNMGVVVLFKDISELKKKYTEDK